MARLFVLSGNLIGASFDFFETSTVGRGDTADIVISEASISRTHARLVPRQDPGQWKVVDLKSSNGVFVGGKRVTSGIISDGDTFRLGEIELRLRDDVGDSPEQAILGEPAEDLVDENFFGEDDEEHDGEEIFPGVVESDEDEGPSGKSGEDGDGDFELEFGDDLDEALASQAKEAKASDAPPPARTLPPSREQESTSKDSGNRAGARATAQRAQRRQEALKGGSGGGSAGARTSLARAGNPSANLSGGGRPALQYSAANQASGVDLAQMSSGKRMLVILLGVALMAGIAYGAFTLTRTAREQSAVLAE